MQVFELKEPSIMGEEHPTYGFTFWSLTDGEYPVMFNSKQGNIMPGTRIMAEEALLKTSKNGKEYLRLKKVKLEDSPGQTQAPFEPKAKPTFKQADQAEDKRSDGITASMAFKLAYHGFIQTEQILPRDDDQWADVKEQARQIFWGIDEVKNSQPDGGQQETVVPKPPTPQSVNAKVVVPSATTSLGDKFRARNVEDGMTAGEPDLTDEDMRDD